MKTNKNLVLIGTMGSGKSTVGYLLSKKLKFIFIDVDRKIEKQENQSISSIFAKKGESYFRKIEEKITIKLLNIKRNAVISLGGGAFTNKNIQRAVLENSISFWLKWKTSTILNRIKKNKKRPLVLKLGKKQMKKLIFFRSKIYCKANFTIKCENLKKSEIVNEIIKYYENKKNIS